MITVNGSVQAVGQDAFSFQQTQVQIALLRMLALGRKQIEEGQVSSHDEFFASLEAADDEVATNAENLKSGQAKFLLLAFRIEKKCRRAGAGRHA